MRSKKQKHCLILGGGGFLGYHLCLALLAAGHKVRIFDRPHRKRYPVPAGSKVEWFAGDFANQEDIELAIRGCDVIYHLVCTTLPRTSNENPAYDVETNVVSTIRLLDLLRHKRETKIIFISSGGTVYGIPQKVPIKETHPTNPICSYGITKLMVEKYLFLYRRLHGLNAYVFRLANPFGERQEVTAEQGAVSVFLKKALQNEAIEIWGDGSIIRDYIYVKDAIDALVRGVDYEGDTRIFNIGSGRGHSLRELLSSIEHVFGRPVKHVYLPKRAFDVPTNVLDTSLAHKILHWHPQTPFTDGLRTTAAWIKAGAS